LIVKRFSLIVLSVLFLGCGRTPQLGADQESFKAVDALYTAVTARRVDLLDNCDTKLRERHASGHLPDAAWKELSAVISQCRDAKWEPAAERLYDFMKRQEMQSGISPSMPLKR
jgi:hypothetical protein